MRRARRSIVIGIVAVVCSAAMGLGLPLRHAARATTVTAFSGHRVGIQVGDRAPDFRLSAYPSNRPLSLSAYRGKPVFLNFWASWCGPCNVEAPDIMMAHHRFGKSVAFLGVNVLNFDRLQDVQRFIVKYHLDYAVVLDSKGTVQKQYRIVGYPTSLFINRRGVIVGRVLGQLSRKQLSAYLAKISS